MKRGLYLFIVLALLLALPLNIKPALSQSDEDSVTRDTLFVPGQVIIGFADNFDVKAVPAQAAALAGEVQAAVLEVEGSMALLEFALGADVEALAQRIQENENIRYAEPNAILWLPELVEAEHETNQDIIVRKSKDGVETIVPIKALQMMKKRAGGTIKAVYPNDPYLWSGGWDYVGASIVFPNTTPSKNVCVIDTGVDHTHPDLLYQVLVGKDFVNNDSAPMDDHGHGTHVAGIIAAKQNNKMGMAGVSTGKVVAVKSLGAQGYGTSYDVAQGIYYCANRSDVSVINMSLGGSYRSQAEYDAVNYAVNVKKKLIVAAAGNSGADWYSYPAAFSVDFPNKVLSVAASGAYVEYDWDDDGNVDYWGLDNWCKADYSNYGSWVDIIAPGTDIYSTVPWKKPFYMGKWSYSNGYRYLSGTSMAAPYVSAVAARAWGFIPGYTNDQISQYIKNTGDWVDEGCWPESMWGATMVNVAGALQRGGAYASIMDANTGLPLNGANVAMYQNGVLRGSAVITPYTFTSGNTTYTYYSTYTDVVNLPASSGYEARVSKSGYTATPQAALVTYSGTSAFNVWAGYWTFGGEGFIPPRNSNFTAVQHSLNWTNSNLVTMLPNLPKPKDDGQPAPFAVGIESGWSAGFWEGETTGNLAVFPFARQLMEGSWMDYNFDTTVIRAKPSNLAVPNYLGDYVFAVSNVSISYPTSFSLWKDGVIKKRVINSCEGLWWRPMTLSQAGGVATYTVNNTCGGNEILPYPIP